ncbi:xyloglucanase Xgh74A [Calothrix brevissima NIES-22]|nr:xyloglucanase Xgh74A [Calothrix brevissima NIES-22]
MKLSLGLGLFYSNILSTGNKPPVVNGYQADRVLIGGGGFILGVRNHPQEAGLSYIFTDVGGAYKLNSSTNKWDAITNFPYFDASPGQQYGVEDLALDPSNPNVVYLCSGKYSTQGVKGDFLKSTNKGATWSKLGLNVYFGGNNADRHTGSMVQVSPHDSNHIIVATRHEGIWLTFNGGLSSNDWISSNLIPCTPYVQKSSWNISRAIRSVHIDKLDQNIVYAALSDQPYTLYNGTSITPYSTANAGLYKSTDKGLNWSKVDNQPAGLTKINRIAQSSNGTIWITHTTGFCKLNTNGTFTNYTNTTLGIGSTGFGAIAVSPFDPLEVTVMTYGNYAKTRIFRTLNAGSTWSEITYTYQTMPWSTPSANAHYLTTNVPDCSYNNHIASNKPDELYFTSFFGVYKTTNSRATTAYFELPIEHVEELVTLGLFCPPASNTRSIPSLISANADIGAFVHGNGFDQYPSLHVDDYFLTLSQHSNRANYPRDIAFCMQQPQHMVLSGTRNFSPYGNILLVSSDAGSTWTPTASLPPGISTSTSGIDGTPQAPRIAYSATTPGVFLVSRTNGEPCLTVNNGNTFITSASDDKPGGDPYTQFSWKFTLAADKVNGNKFYYIKDYQLWLATWNGSTTSPSYTWQLINPSTGLSSSHTYQGILTAPNQTGHLWIYSSSTSTNSPKLAKSVDGGYTFTSITGFDKVILAAIGKGSGAEGDADYTVYAFGSRSNVWGVYQSVDLGNNWNLLDTGDLNIANDPNCMAASLQTFGEVFIGSNGSGIYWITPKQSELQGILLREDGDYLLREDSSYILQEDFTNNPVSNLLREDSYSLLREDNSLLLRQDNIN